MSQVQLVDPSRVYCLLGHLPILGLVDSNLTFGRGLDPETRDLQFQSSTSNRGGRDHLLWIWSADVRVDRLFDSHSSSSLREGTEAVSSLLLH